MTIEGIPAGEDHRTLAEAHTAAALARTGIPDPRGRYRVWLRALREQNQSGFQEALALFERQIEPGVAADDSDPIALWTRYGLRLATLLEPGSAVRVDGEGRSRPCEEEAPLDELVLHLPTSQRRPALPVRIPAEPTAAQTATLDLLVRHLEG